MVPVELSWTSVELFRRLTHESPLPAKAWLPTACTRAGSSRNCILRQPSKTMGPICDKLELAPNRTATRDLQPLNAERLIWVTCIDITL